MIISFSITSKLARKFGVDDPLYTGQKTVTRRVWCDRTARSWCKAYDQGKLEHKAYNTAAFVKGAKQIGTITLTARPYQERLCDLPEEDLVNEGGFWQSKQEFIDLVGDGDGNLLVWVVRFKFKEVEMYDDKTFLSFGGGVQSTALAVMIARHPQLFVEKGLKIPKHIIFADTGAEPDYVLQNVENVFSILDKAGLSTYIVRAKDSILDDVKTSTGRGISTPPYFTKNNSGEMGILRRQCTKTYKIEPITKKQREILGYKPKQRIPENFATLWLGISIEEARRARLSKTRWLQNEFPLLKLGLDRTACAVYCYKELGYQVRKSSCFFCPFKHQDEWVRMKREEPEEFKKACEFDERIRTLNTFGNKGIKQECYIHRSGYPLKDAAGKGIQLSLFNQELSECSGGCFL